MIAALLALALPAGAALPVPPQASATTLTLDGCVGRALEQATAVLEGDEQVKTAGAALLESYGRFLPDLNASGDLSRAWGHPFFTIAGPTLENTINYGGSYALATALNVFNGFSDYASLKAAVAGDKAAELTLERARQSVALDAAQSYLQVLLDGELIAIQQSSLKVSQEREAALSEQARVGASSVVDLYQQQAATSLTQSALISTRARARDDLYLLLVKLRLDVSQDYALAPVTFDTATARSYGDEQALVSYALSRRPDVRAARAALREAREGVVSARAGYWPSLQASFGVASASRLYERDILNGVDSLPPSQPALGPQMAAHVNYNLALDANWALFDRFVTHLAVARAKELERDAEIGSSDTSLRAQSDVRSAFADYGAAIEQAAASEVRLEAAQKAFEAMEGRYSVRAASFLDLITAQDVLTQARAARAEALIGLDLEGRAMEYALGNGP